MNKYLKEFLIRGFLFSGLGPVVFGIVAFCLSRFGIEMTGKEVFMGIVSTYLLAFIQAGITIAEQVEEWSTTKAAFVHLIVIYIAYTATYLINSWIPYNTKVIAIFSACVIIGFVIIWLIAYLASNRTRKLLNDRITTKTVIK